MRLSELNPHFLRVKLCQKEHVHFLMQQLTGVADIDRSLNFVTCQDPYLNSSALEIKDSLSNLFLQLVFNGSRTYQIKVNFKLLRNSIDGGLFVERS